jgi:hypothetical protein
MKLFKLFFLPFLALAIVEDAPAADSATVTTDAGTNDVQQTGTEALETAQASVDAELAGNVDAAATVDSTTAASTESTVDAGNVSSTTSSEPLSSGQTVTGTSDVATPDSVTSVEPEDVVGGLVASLEAEIDALGTALTADLRAVWAELKAAL